MKGVRKIRTGTKLKPMTTVVTALASIDVQERTIL